ncbi:hypothetical protein [Flavobacterium limnosediminis]|uniref:hypothetical protein n=1 Tax=Flavobacterium limnosediminis TaxID=1401027 RepID=UPI00040427C9|nr:hypothetical protein [Flavobacterium limnosediminis]
MQNNSTYNSESYGLSCACQEQPQGLGGFWSEAGAWAWRKVKNNISALGTIGYAISQVMETIDGSCYGKFSTWLQQNGGCGTSKTATIRDYTLTESELAMVESWATNYFSPFYEKIINSCNEIFVGQKPLDEQLKIINAALTKMTLFLEYVKTNPNGFTVNANKEQMIGVEEFFAYADKVIQDIIFEADVLLDTTIVKVSSTGLDFSPFAVPAISTTADLWKVANGSFVPQNVTLQPTAAQTEAVLTLGTNTSQAATDTKSGLSGGAIVLLISSCLGALYMLNKKSDK